MALQIKPPLQTRPPYEFGKAYKYNDVNTHVEWDKLKASLDKQQEEKDPYKWNQKELLAIAVASVPLDQWSLYEYMSVTDDLLHHHYSLPQWSAQIIHFYTRDSDWCRSLRASLRTDGRRHQSDYVNLELLRMAFVDYTVKVNDMKEKEKKLLINSVSKNVFHGIGGVNKDFCVDIFKQFDERKLIKWAGPLSTTSQVEHAVMFSGGKNGIILELKPKKHPFYGMDVAPLSFFDYEKEILFFNGQFKLVNIYEGDGREKYEKTFLSAKNCLKFWADDDATDFEDVPAALKLFQQRHKKYAKAELKILRSALYDCLRARYYAYYDEKCWKQMAPNSYQYYKANPIKRGETNYLYNGEGVMILEGLVLLTMICALSCLFGMAFGYVVGKINKRDNKICK